jgi:hypothetical protein
MAILNEMKEKIAYCILGIRKEFEAASKAREMDGDDTD